MYHTYNRSLIEGVCGRGCSSVWVLSVPRCHNTFPSQRPRQHWQQSLGVFYLGAFTAYAQGAGARFIGLTRRTLLLLHSWPFPSLSPFWLCSILPWAWTYNSWINTNTNITYLCSPLWTWITPLGKHGRRGSSTEEGFERNWRKEIVCDEFWAVGEKCA